jgi:hypothetical protein
VRRVPRAAVLIACLAAAACGGEEIERDHTASFVACLKRHGGTTVRAAPQLAGLPWDTAEAGSSFGLERLVYSEIYVGDRTVVVLFPLGLRTDHMSDVEFWRAVRTDPGRFRRVVLVGDDNIVEDCREKVAPGETVP